MEALRRLNRNDIFSLVVYAHEVDSLIPAQSASLTEWMESRIHGIQPRGNTALFGGVSQGAAELRKNITTPYTHRLILLSDGLANVGPSSPADLARLGTGLLKEGISVTTVGVGTGFNEDLMTQMAEASDGNHYFVESSVDLPRIFAKELGDVLSVAPRQILVEITCPTGVRPVRIIGRDGQIKGDTVQLYMNQLYGGQEKYALVEVEVPAGNDGTIMEIASAKCSYENAFSQRKEQASGSIKTRFSGRDDEVKDSANAKIRKAVISNEIAVSQDRALDLYNAGETSGPALSCARNIIPTRLKHSISPLRKDTPCMRPDLPMTRRPMISVKAIFPITRGRRCTLLFPDAGTPAGRTPPAWYPRYRA